MHEDVRKAQHLEDSGIIKNRLRPLVETVTKKIQKISRRQTLSYMWTSQRLTSS